MPAHSRPHLRVAANPGDSHQQDIAQAAADWLHTAAIDHLLCRGDHAFPKIKPGRSGKLPKGVRATPMTGNASKGLQNGPIPDQPNLPRLWHHTAHSPVHQGAASLVTCRPSYRYEWPEGYRMPKGAAEYVSQRDCKDEAFRQVIEGGLI